MFPPKSYLKMAKSPNQLDTIPKIFRINKNLQKQKFPPKKTTTKYITLILGEMFLGVNSGRLKKRFEGKSRLNKIRNSVDNLKEQLRIQTK